VNILIFRDFLDFYIALVGIFGLVYTRNQPKSHWRYFPIFLIILGILDKCGLYIYRFLGDSIGIYYYYSLIIIPYQIIYYLYILNKSMLTDKKIHYIGLAVYFLSIIAEIAIFKDYKNPYFLSLSYTIGNLVLLANILRYFYQLSSSDKILSFFREKMFWVSLGLLIFWLGALPFYGLFNLLNTDYPNVFSYYYRVMFVFNYSMYTCFLISFIWGKKN
jgi:hypothetical protein